MIGDGSGMGGISLLKNHSICTTSHVQGRRVAKECPKTKNKQLWNHKLQQRLLCNLDNLIFVFQGRVLLVQRSYFSVGHVVHQ